MKIIRIFYYIYLKLIEKNSLVESVILSMIYILKFLSLLYSDYWTHL